MLLLLSLFLLLYQADDLQASKTSPVVFTAVKQRPAGDQGCVPLFSRRITFRIKNRSDKTVYIHGLRTPAGYYPSGQLLRHVGEHNRWVGPGGDASQHPYKGGPGAADVYVLPPGKSMEFNNMAEEVYVGNRVKRGIYISFGRGGEPRMLLSEEFLLR